jgi:gliding motility-associated-like protein
VPAPVTVELTPDQPIEVNSEESTTTLSGLVEGPQNTSYSWDLVDGTANAALAGTAPYDASIEADFPEVRERTVTLTGDDGRGCRVVDSVQIRTDKQQFIFVPNVFTPNGDGMNDELKLETAGVDYTLTIYDRWGSKVYTGNQDDAPWNGQVNNSGEPVPEGVYIFQMEVNKTVSGETFERSGTVTVIR